MDSQKTTHILLAIIAVGIFFMIFLFMKERYFSNPATQPIVWEETVPAQPVSRPDPVQNPTPTSTPTPVTQQNINLVVGQSYPREFTTDTSISSAKYCGIKEYTPLSGIKSSFMIFSSTQTCVPGESGTTGLSLKEFNVKLKSANDYEKLKELNKKYGVSIVPLNYPQNEPTILSIGNSTLNTYTLAKIYFDTGYFEWTGPIPGFSVNPGDGVN